MGTLIFMLTIVGCVLFAYAWGVATGFAVARGQHWFLDRVRQRLERRGP